MPSIINKLLKKSVSFFIILWILVFLLYFITAHAGWVTDTVDWQYRVSHAPFWEYLNLVQTHVPSLYQFTQLVTYALYKVFGFNAWDWHLLFITLHAFYTTLLFMICRTVLEDSGNKNATIITAGALILYSIAPHVSEVLVWKASFHYLLAGTMIALNLFWLQRFLKTPKTKFAVLSFIVFFLSTFSLEVFYLVPWFVLSLIVYYRFVLKAPYAISRKALQLFFIPQLILFVFHLALLCFVTGSYIAHLSEGIYQPATAYLRKPGGYLFHIVFLGRFFPPEIKSAVYAFIASAKGIVIFYLLFFSLIAGIIIRFRKVELTQKPITLFFAWMLLYLVLLMPLWLPELQLVAYDRYAYLMLPFIYLLLAMLISRIPWQPLIYVLVLPYFLINVYFTLRVNRLWQKSARVVNALTEHFPSVDNKIVLLLNIPENFNGVPMIGSLPESFFKLRYNVYHRPEIQNKVYDVSSYNIISPADGAHVSVVNDSTVHVTLNQWGTWWWYSFQGGRSYETDAYRLNMTDVGHWYELILKKPSDQYQLLYQVGDQWKEVDMSKKDIEQD